MKSPRPTTLVFPTSFVLKVIGQHPDDLAAYLLPIIQAHAPNTTLNDIRVRSSRTGRYAGLSITVFATSQAQLDALYHTLVADPFVQFVL